MITLKNDFKNKTFFKNDRFENDRFKIRTFLKSNRFENYRLVFVFCRREDLS